jgi:hypothetical protein
MNTDQEKLQIAKEALSELQTASLMLASRIGLSITVKRIAGKDKQADLEEQTFLVPWEKAAEQAKNALKILREEA